MTKQTQTQERVVVYIPIYNNAAWCHQFAPVAGFDFIVSDNASTDGSADILEKKGITVIRQSSNLGRTGNWEFCIDHFKKSGRRWMKLHMAGDEILPDAPATVDALMNKYPDARFIAAGAEIVRADGRVDHFRPVDKEQYIESVEAVKRIAVGGNWLGIPLTIFLHKDVLNQEFSFGKLSWAADLYWYLSLASTQPVLCSPAKVGRLIIRPDRLHGKMENSFKARSEEGIVRSEALELYRKLSNCSPEKYEQVVEEYQADMEQLVLQRAIARKPADAHVARLSRTFLSNLQTAYGYHLVNAPFVTDPIPFKTLVASVVRRGKQYARHTLDVKRIRKKYFGKDRETIEVENEMATIKEAERFLTTSPGNLTRAAAPRIVHLFHAFIPDFVNKEEVQVPHAVCNLTGGEWTAYMTRPIACLDEMKDIPFIAVGDPVPESLLAKDPGLYTFCDEEFAPAYAKSAAAQGDFLYLMGNRNWFRWRMVKTALGFKKACIKRGVKGFIYVKMDAPAVIAANYFNALKADQNSLAMKSATMAFSLLDCVSFESEEATQIARDVFPAFSDKIITVRNCPARSFWEQATSNKAERQRSILAIARHGAPHKDTPTLLKGFRKFLETHPDWKLDLVGEIVDTFYPVFMGLAKDLVESGSIRLHGAIKDTTQLASFYRNCGIYALPSKGEGASLSLIEAAFFGCPLAVTDDGNAKELTGDLFPYFEVKTNSPDSLAERFRLLANNPQQTSELGEKLAVKTGKTYTWEAQLKPVIDIWNNNKLK